MYFIFSQPDAYFFGGGVNPATPEAHGAFVQLDFDAFLAAAEANPQQVWSLSIFKVNHQVSTNDLIQVSSVSLLMTASTALANEGLFELTRRPSLTRAVSLSFAETTEEPGRSQVKKLKLKQI